ncbi:CaiB/BaiF CoA transferase family protein [Bordetella petrii]|uniref:CaiB/BaiF CoA transferase family protein n=1 Tax=Bordetella petrii TaxID=94624 RepID=UPI001A97AD57|nr:CoA transferase [Bordetella petrii]MBO1111016.1 CoA transferase [Bordetella petrii]
MTQTRTPELPGDAPARRPGAGALAGIRVVDLSRVLAGPLCTQMLADHGADIVKVEPPFGDETRRLGPPFEASGDAAYFGALNRGKRSIGLNLAQPDDRQVLHGLLRDADVLVENFLPGTMQKWQLDFERDLAPRYPGLVYCSITGFGGDGPLGGLPGYDAVLQAMCGLMSVNGSTGSGPTRIGVPIVDHLTGYVAFSGILMALLARQHSGAGQRVEATLFDTALSLLVPHAANWFCSGQAPGLTGNAHPNIAPYDQFDAGDGPIFLGILNDGQFRKFCERVARPGLAQDPRFQSNALRLRNAAALRAEIEAALQGCRRDDLCRDLMAAGVAAGPVNTVPQAFAHAHARHRHMHVAHGAYQGIGLPVKLSVTPGQAGAAPPGFDQHRDAVLRQAAASGQDPAPAGNGITQEPGSANT